MPTPPPDPPPASLPADRDRLHDLSRLLDAAEAIETRLIRAVARMEYPDDTDYLPRLASAAQVLWRLTAVRKTLVHLDAGIRSTSDPAPRDPAEIDGFELFNVFGDADLPDPDPDGSSTIPHVSSVPASSPTWEADSVGRSLPHSSSPSSSASSSAPSAVQSDSSFIPHSAFRTPHSPSAPVRAPDLSVNSAPRLSPSALSRFLANTDRLCDAIDSPAPSAPSAVESNVSSPSPSSISSTWEADSVGRSSSQSSPAPSAVESMPHSEFPTPHSSPPP